MYIYKLINLLTNINMSEKLKVGDIVKLKSGGLKMTVNSLLSDQSVACVWMTSEGEIQTITLRIEAVELVAPSKRTTISL